MEVKRTNGDTSPFPFINWSIEIIGSRPDAEMQSMIEKVTGYFKDSSIFLLPRVLTEMITEET